MAVLELALVGLAVAAWARRRKVAGVGADWTPTAAERAGWVQLADGPGIAVRSAAHAWTTPAVVHVVEAMGRAAAELGGALQVADVGQKQRGVEFKPHLSHRWGRDMDLGYTLDVYPTPEDVGPDPRIVEVLAAALPWIEVVGVNEARRGAFKGAPFKVEAWTGHMGHLHLRLKASLTVEPRKSGRTSSLLHESDEDD